MHFANANAGGARVSRAQLVVLTLIVGVTIAATIAYGVLRLYI